MSVERKRSISRKWLQQLWGLAGLISSGQAVREMRLEMPGQALKPQPTGRSSSSGNLGLALLIRPFKSYQLLNSNLIENKHKSDIIYKILEIQRLS